MANNYGAFVSTVPAFLNVVDFAHRLVGPKPLEYLSGAMNRMSNHLVPTWNPYMPRVRPCKNPRPPICIAPFLLNFSSKHEPPVGAHLTAELEQGYQVYLLFGLY
jgi:hypothetical protein